MDCVFSIDTSIYRHFNISVSILCDKVPFLIAAYIYIYLVSHWLHLIESRSLANEDATLKYGRVASSIINMTDNLHSLNTSVKLVRT